jgi:hypothetical protein
MTEEEVVAPVETPEPPPRTVPYKNGSRTYKRKRGRNSPPETQSFERRLELTKQAARLLAKQQATRIPLRLGVPLEMHETLVAIGEAIGGVKVPDVALQCIEDGMLRWARELHIKTNVNEATAGPTPVFDRTPLVANAHRGYGIDETRAREELQDEAIARRDAREKAAADLHLPGRRKSAAAP